jgi:hypothetical protein
MPFTLQAQGQKMVPCYPYHIDSLNFSDSGLLFAQPHSQRPSMLQHYRMRQRKYWAWKRQHQDSKDGPSYFPPHLRQLRLEWFAKRFEKYGQTGIIEDADWELMKKEMDEFLQEADSDSETLAEKIWKWLNGSCEENATAQTEAKDQT